MFGKNQIVGRSHFDDAGDRLLVTSIFITLQGEGPFQGRPAVFVRLAKCNLACSFCDTFFDQGDWFTVGNLAREISHRAILKYPNEVGRKMGVVITGGEPSLQKNVAALLQRLDGFAFTQIESNGILLLDELPEWATMVVSPKCAEKDGKATKYLQPNAAVLARADCLKFVMSADGSTPYSTVPDWALQWTKHKGRPIYVSPMNIYNRLPQKTVKLFSMPDGTKESDLQKRSDEEVISFWEPGLLDMAANKRNHEYAARYALDRGLFLTLQQHLFASLA